VGTQKAKEVWLTLDDRFSVFEQSQFIICNK